MDVSETDNEIVISAEMPGLQRDDMQITVDDDVLTIRGEKRVERHEGGEGQELSRERTKLRRVRAHAPAAGRHRSIEGGSNHVKWRADDQEPQAVAQRTQEDKGQGPVRRETDTTKLGLPVRRRCEKLKVRSKGRKLEARKRAPGKAEQVEVKKAT
jgi:hypothetical protein